MKIGVIFDMDGVICDTQKYHAQAEIEILNSFGILTVDPDSDKIIDPVWIGANFAGVQPKERMKQVFEKHGKLDVFDAERVEQAKHDKLLEMYKSGVPIEFIPGAKKFITDFASFEEVCLAVVTASTRDCMLFVLEKLDIKGKFHELVSIYDIDIRTGKPYVSKGEANAYQNISKKYGFRSNFVMIEDGATGMNGATKAGGKAIAILGDNPAAKFPQAISHHKDFSTMKVWEVIGTLGG